MNHLRHIIEAAGMLVAFGLFRLLPLDTASAFGGWLGRTLGPRLGVHRVAVANIRQAFPEMPEAEVRRVLCEMWDNLGRVVGEYPHLNRASFRHRIAFEGEERIRALVEAKKPAIFLAAHLANWELIPRTATGNGMPITLVYRHANNPFVDRLIHRMRSDALTTLQRKGAQGTLQVVRTLRSGGAVGLLMDQKTNEGISVPFFGRDAMTSPTAARLALKYGVPLIPVQIVRHRGVQFTITVHPPLDMHAEENTDAGVAAVTRRINATMEDWIRAHPEQWFWVHRRWPG